jgi:uncharacterized repeat protein (TIGR01451 family)
MSTAARPLLACAAALAALCAAPAIALGETARLAVEVTDSADPLTLGDQLTYTITVTNGGPDPATQVRLVDKLAPKLDFVSAVPSEGNCERPSTRRIVCTIDTIASGATATLVVRVRPTRVDRILNTATVSARETDPVPANNSETEATQVISPPTFNCAGRRATVVGTEGDDELTGTEGPDVIAALSGNDRIEGLGGDDVICGSGGEDAVKAGTGRDTLRGGGGDDQLRGGDGGDNIRGKAGSDGLAGGRADDVLRGGGGTDVCRGGPGSDVKKRC